MKLGKRKKNNNQDDFLAQEAKEEAQTAPAYTLDIPEDEIWTYQIEGLQEPCIGKKYDNAKIKKIIVVAVLLIAICCSIYLSARVVHNDEFEYNTLENGTYELVKYSNPGEITQVTIDYVDSDTQKPITVLHEYAFNCDEKITSVTLGKEIQKIDGKSFYSCWALQNIYVDDDNPYYCDLDGVLYNKDMTEIILYPIDHDKYLRSKTGYDNLLDDDGKPMEDLWGVTERYDEKFLDEYNKAVRTYVVPSTVETIGKLAFAYANITDLYIPEGVKKIETMGVFRAVLANLYTYKTDKPVTGTTYKTAAELKNVYKSLPEGLEYIGSDAFTYDSSMTYVYIPSSVKYIGHHAFWDTVYKEDGELKGVTEINTASDENSFKSNVDTGNQWRPRYDYMLFKKSVGINFSAERE